MLYKQYGTYDIIHIDVYGPAAWKRKGFGAFTDHFPCFFFAEDCDFHTQLGVPNLRRKVQTVHFDVITGMHTYMYMYSHMHASCLQTFIVTRAQGAHINHTHLKGLRSGA